MNEIYFCNIIFKDDNREGSTKGDLGYVPDKDLPELVEKYRILKSDIKCWGEYKNGDKNFL